MALSSYVSLLLLQQQHSDAKYCSTGSLHAGAAVSPWPLFLHGSGPSSYIWVFRGLARAASTHTLLLKHQARYFWLKSSEV